MSYGERTARLLQAKGFSLEMVEILSQVKDLRPLIGAAKEHNEASRCPDCGYRSFLLSGDQEAEEGDGPTMWNIDCEYCGAHWRVPSDCPMLDYTD